MNDLNNGTDDTSPTFKAFEEESKMSKRSKLAISYSSRKVYTRFKKCISRVENKTYGLCVK
jgi:RNA polymerase-binding transcription factor DksA